MGNMRGRPARGVHGHGHGRATDPTTSPLARRCPGSRVAGGQRGATCNALDAAWWRANPRSSGRRLERRAVTRRRHCCNCGCPGLSEGRGTRSSCPERVAGGVREDGREAPARSAGPRGAKRGRTRRAGGALEPVKKLATDRHTAGVILSRRSAHSRPSVSHDESHERGATNSSADGTST